MSNDQSGFLELRECTHYVNSKHFTRKVSIKDTFLNGVKLLKPCLEDGPKHTMFNTLNILTDLKGSNEKNMIRTMDDVGGDLLKRA